MVCAASCANFYEDSFVYYRVDLRDKVNEAILDAIQSFILFVDSLESENAKILVHCREGKSRAPIVISGYLVSKLGISFEEAISFVRARRPKIDPNFGFLLNGTASFKARLSRPPNLTLEHDSTLDLKELKQETESSDILDIRLGPTPALSKISSSPSKLTRLGKKMELPERSLKSSAFKPKRTCLKNLLLERAKRRMQWKRSSSSTSTCVSEFSPRAPCSV